MTTTSSREPHPPSAYLSTHPKRSLSVLPSIMGGKPSKVTAQDKAILDLKSQRDKLHQYQRRITLLTDKETDVARQLLARGDKKGALLALRRKKYQESLLSKTDAQLEQLEKLTANVEFARIQKDVVFGLQQGTKVLKEIHAEMGGIEHEVSDMLGGRISNQDEQEVEDELAALQADVVGENKELPSVPIAHLHGRQTNATQESVKETEPERSAILAA
ncbi:hypothetical protein CP533_5746 [Ophiocordyceps camponoti-saundersi (nom. inval.)]|nr:hypothetical protein CP533_5746 [Ophiocordyceps camponoti-saundersi (nom. inval.)]